MKRFQILCALMLVCTLLWATGNPPVETFNYTNASDLSTQNGGIYWSAGWVKVGGQAITVDTSSPTGTPSSARAAKSLATAGDTTYTRAFSTLTPSTDTTIPLYVRTTDCSPTTDYYYVNITSGGTALMALRIQGAQLQIFDNGSASYQNVLACSVNTWYKVEFNFNDVTQNDKYRMRINGGTYSSYYTVSGGTLTSVDGIALIDGNTAAHTVYFADIGTSEAPALLLTERQRR